MSPLCRKVIGNALHSLLKLDNIGQENNAEMVMSFQIEAGTPRDEHLLLAQKFEGKFLIVFNIIIVGIDFRENVKGGVGPDGREPRNFAYRLAYVFALLVYAPARPQIFVAGLVPAERSLNNALSRDIRAEPH